MLQLRLRYSRTGPLGVQLTSSVKIDFSLPVCHIRVSSSIELFFGCSFGVKGSVGSFP